MREVGLRRVLPEVLALLLCAAVVSPVSAADAPVPGSTTTMTGTENTEAFVHSDVRGLTLNLEKDATLAVPGGFTAVSLGAGGTVNLASGAQVSLSQRKWGRELCAIKLDGEGESDDNRVTMGTRSSVVVEGSGASVAAIDVSDAAEAHVTMDGAVLKSTAVEGDAYGLSMNRIDFYTTAQLLMTNGSSIEVRGSALADRKNRPSVSGTSYGVAVGETAHGVVSLSGASTIGAKETATDKYAGGRAVGVSMVDVAVADVTLDGKSKINAESTSAGAYGRASGTGVELRAMANDGTATIAVANGSEISGYASGTVATAAGAVIQNYSHGVVNVTGGSTLSTTADATGVSNGSKLYLSSSAVMANASVLAMENVGEADITLDGSSVIGTMRAAAVTTDSEAAVAIVGRTKDSVDFTAGVGAMGYDRAAVRLSDATVKVTANATASSSGGSSRAMAGSLVGMDGAVSGLYMGGALYDADALKERVTSVDLRRSSVDVMAESTAETESVAVGSGIDLIDLNGQTDLRLVDSTVHVSATATATQGVAKTADPDFGNTLAVATGIVAQNNSGDTTLLLDHSTVAVEATAASGMAFGIVSDRSGASIELNNGSLVSERHSVEKMLAEGDCRVPSFGAAILVMGSASIKVDATSALSGEWAVKVNNLADDAEFAMPAVVTLNNSGLIKGRLTGVTLTNAASGVLVATLGADGAFVYDANAQAHPFYFMTEAATLAGGTTFCVNPATDNMGLAKPGDSAEYALLRSASTGVWDQKTLNLKAIGNSPMLGLTWSDKSTEKELIAQIRFLTPAEAGLSRNATEAFRAARADMPNGFVMGTDPEAWAPNVSGAFLTGMTQTLGASRTNIGNRLGGLMGLNTGDEIVAANGLWYNAAFATADQNARGGIAGFDADTAGLSLGFDRQVGPVTVGVAVTVGKTDADANDSSAALEMDDNLFSLYGSYNSGKWFGEAVLSAGVGDVDSTRRMGAQTFAGSYDSTSYNALAKVGMRLRSAGWQINPLLAVDYSNKSYDSYTEAGGVGALAVDSQEYTVLNVGGGATVQRSWVKGWGIVTPEVAAMLHYDLKGDRVSTTAKFVGGSTSFVSLGADPAETSWDLSTALTLASAAENAVSLRLGYDYTGRQDFSAHSVSGKVRFEF